MSNFSPYSFSVCKLPASFVAERGFTLPDPLPERFRIRQQDNLFFRQLRLLGRDPSDSVIFLYLGGKRLSEAQLTRLIVSGFTVGRRCFVCSERSASMVRSGALAFVESDIAPVLDERVSLGVDPGSTALAKYLAYRGLMFSSCHALEGVMPKLIVVPDLTVTIKNQLIRHAADELRTFEGSDGSSRTYTQKAISESVMDVDVNAFDGCGIHHPAITELVRSKIGIGSRPTTMLWRAPFIKGVTHEFDYSAFLAERGVGAIRDRWGHEHDASEPMIILTESMYKGLKYMKRDDTYSDWLDYLARLEKYGHCLGVARWNLTVAEESPVTDASYQILQDLALPYDKFRTLASRGLREMKRLAELKKPDIYCFIGAVRGSSCPDKHAQAVLKNPALLAEKGVASSIRSRVRARLESMCAGKLPIRATFRFLAPDLVAFAEHIGGLPVRGCLSPDECYTRGRDGAEEGARLLERNPHICASEHTVLTAVSPELAERWCGGLDNVCMVNIFSLTARRLNGADYDGDLVLVADEPVMLEGVDPGAAIVLDTDDKITAPPEENTPLSRAAVVARSQKQMIGEISNYATVYHNRVPKTDEVRKRQSDCVDLLSIINGKAIDSAKTGVIYPVPRFISKYARPLPYFMRYAGPYYARMKDFSLAPSNMNRLCREIESSAKQLKFARGRGVSFDWRMLTDDSIPRDADKLAELDALYTEYNSLTKKRAVGQQEIADAAARDIELLKQRVTALGSQKELANLAAELCYVTHPSRTSAFLWFSAADGIIENLRPARAKLPKECEKGIPHSFEYNGRTYVLAQEV